MAKVLSKLFNYNYDYKHPKTKKILLYWQSLLLLLKYNKQKGDKTKVMFLSKKLSNNNNNNALTHRFMGFFLLLFKN